MFIKNKNIFKGLILSLAIVSLFAFGISKAFAATINFEPSYGTYATNGTVRVKVTVSSSSSINAVSGTIKFPNDLLNLTSISKAGSVISLWAQEPSYSNNSGTASFEGVILNGYKGNGGTAITLVFTAKKAGTANLSFSSASVLANDGNGTDVLSSKGTGSYTITNSQVEKTPPPAVNVDNTVIKIEEVGNNKNAQKKFLVTAPQSIKDNAYMVAVDFLDIISWIDDGSHIYEAPILSSGSHVIKMIATSDSGKSLSGFIEFSTSAVATPNITDYPTNIFVNDFLVLKGTANPLADVAITITDMKTGEANVAHVQANNAGKFSFVSDNRMVQGTYTAIAKAITKDGLESENSNIVQIEVKKNLLNNILSKLGSYLTLVVPIIALIILILFLMVYGLYHLKRVRNILKKKLSRTEDIVSKSFGLLEEDVNQEIAIFRKIRTNKPLNETERSFLNRLKRDIESAEKVVLKEVKDLEKKK